MFHVDYRYAQDYQSDFIFRCSKRRSCACSGRIKFYIDISSIDDSLTDDDFEILGSHEDMPDYKVGGWLDMIDTMKERCRTTHDRLIDIFNDVNRR